MIIVTSAVLAAAIGAAQTPPAGGCYTSDPACSGIASFHNFQRSTNCASVRSPGGVFNFCVPANSNVERHVPASSQYCWSGGNYPPPRACDLQWIFVTKPDWLRK